MLDPHWLKVYCVFGAVESILNGVYAGTIWFRAPDLNVAAEKINGKAWVQPWKDLFSHPFFLYQAWFNFIGAAAGWVSGGYLWWRIADRPSRFGWVEAGLSLAAALGICGYLPNVLHSIAHALREIAKLLLGLFSRFPPGGSPAQTDAK